MASVTITSAKEEKERIDYTSDLYSAQVPI